MKWEGFLLSVLILVILLGAFGRAGHENRVMVKVSPFGEDMFRAHAVENHPFHTWSGYLYMFPVVPEEQETNGINHWEEMELDDSFLQEGPSFIGIIPPAKIDQGLEHSSYVIICSKVQIHTMEEAHQIWGDSMVNTRRSYWWKPGQKTVRFFLKCQ